MTTPHGRFCRHLAGVAVPDIYNIYQTQRLAECCRVQDIVYCDHQSSTITAEHLATGKVTPLVPHIADRANTNESKTSTIIMAS
jgi:hypothetical protein